MKKSLLFAALALSSAMAIAAEVKKADKDNDGTLDKNEAKAIPMIAKNFDLIDVDKEGTIEQAEIDAFKVMQADRDNDGTLEPKEVKHKGVAKAFKQLDGDNDGTLDAKEVFAFFQKSSNGKAKQ